MDTTTVRVYDKDRVRLQNIKYGNADYKTVADALAGVLDFYDKHTTKK